MPAGAVHQAGPLEYRAGRGVEGNRKQVDLAHTASQAQGEGKGGK